MKVHLDGLEFDPLAASAVLGIPPTGGVLLHPASLEVVQLDAAGARFWTALRQAETVEKATASLAETHGVSCEQVADDMAAFVAALDVRGLVARCDEAPEQVAATGSASGTPPDRSAASGREGVLRVSAILAAHDRRAATVRCLRALFGCVPENCDLTAVLVDDGSTDGTSAAVRALGLPVEIIAGPGDWYWSRSMAEAEAAAEQHDPDLLLWLNDDVEVTPSALRRAIAAHRADDEALLVGALWSASRGDVSFTGMRVTTGAWGRLAPTVEKQTIDSFHGNFVLVPRSVRKELGAIDGSWPHHFADLDYAARARAKGLPIVLLPGLMGFCEPQAAAWLDPDEPWNARVRAMLGRKGWPITARWRFLRRHEPLVRWRDEIGAYAAVLSGASARRPPRPRLLNVTGGHSDGDRSKRPSGSATRTWSPTRAADLIRLGPPRDGGYVVSRAAVLAASHLISGGLADDWAFEAAFRELNPIPVDVYDGTMGWTFWAAHAGRAATQLAQHPSTEAVRDLARYLAYRRFFAQRGVTHIRRNLTATGAGSTGLLHAIDSLPAGDVFVKLDIEGGEYSLLGSLVARSARITGLVMEVHSVDTHAEQLAQFVARFDDHILTFVRDNNAGGVDPEGQPRMLEMTWTRRDLFEKGEPALAPLTYDNVEDPSDVRRWTSSWR